MKREVEPRLLLVHFIRDLGALTGTKVGCDTSQCGSCTILLDGISAKSCTTLTVQADGADVTTIEGLADETHCIHSRKAFGTNMACSVDFVLLDDHGLHELLRTNADPSDTEIRHGLEGNMCRCTGYQNIVRAVHDAAAAGKQS
ncbi:MAG: (2Fe-2S)-binding protein [Acidobacteriota bacterium]|nr:MAG: (2Fe-2S)-binding protein [Acidobacteriota bacterium]